MGADGRFRSLILGQSWKSEVIQSTWVVVKNGYLAQNSASELTKDFIGVWCFQDMIDGETTTTRPRAGSVNLSISRDIAPMRPRFGSVNSKDMMTMEANKKETALENMLYDKYRAKFFNPLHSKPTGEGVAPESKSKGVLYDLDGKFAYSTYSEEMRSYHPMLDIRSLTKDLKYPIFPSPFPSPASIFEGRDRLTH